MAAEGRLIILLVRQLQVLFCLRHRVQSHWDYISEQHSELGTISIHYALKELAVFKRASKYT